MRHIWLQILTFFCLVTCWLTAAATPVLDIVTDSNDYPPFVMRNHYGYLKGFDIALMKALCQVMHLECRFHTRHWSNLIPEVQNGRFHVGIAGFSITQDRKQYVAFTDPYYEAPASMLLRNGQDIPFDLANLKTKHIGVLNDTIYEDYFNILLLESNIEKYQHFDRAIDDLVNNRIDAILADKPFLVYWLKHSQHHYNLHLSHDGPASIQYLYSHYGIILNKKDKELRKAFNQALAQLKRLGILQKLINNYFQH